MNSLTLAVDSSSENLAVALLDQNKVLVEIYQALSQPHSQNLMATIDWILRQADVELKQIERLVVSRGPGAFSGLRIGIASLQGLAQALNKPLYTFIGHDLIAAKFTYRPGAIAVLTDARRRQVYWSLYRSDGKILTRLTPCRVADPEVMAQQVAKTDIILAGSGVEVYNDELAELLPDAIRLGSTHAKPNLALIAGMSLLDDEDEERVGLRPASGSFEPLYVRASDAEINLQKKLQGKLKEKSDG